MSRRSAIRLRWETPDPPGLAARLGRLGFAVEDAAGADPPSVALGVDRIELVRRTADGGIRSTQLRPGDGDGYLAGFELEAVGADPGRAASHANGAVALAALGWATVDGERLARSAFRARAFLPIRDEPALGAAVRAATLDAERPVPLRLLLLEPRREAFAAAALARLGEGPVALYVATVDLAATERFLRGHDVSLLRLAVTSLGRPGLLARGARPWSPAILFVAA